MTVRASSLVFLLLLSGITPQAAEVSITMDDPHLYSTPLLSGPERNEKILQALRKHQVHAVLFVCGKRIDSVEGKNLLKTWQLTGHSFGNHTYSHLSYASPEMSFEKFSADSDRAEALRIA